MKRKNYINQKKNKNKKELKNLNTNNNRIILVKLIILMNF